MELYKSEFAGKTFVIEDEGDSHSFRLVKTLTEATIVQHNFSILDETEERFAEPSRLTTKQDAINFIQVKKAELQKTLTSLEELVALLDSSLYTELAQESDYTTEIQEDEED